MVGEILGTMVVPGGPMSDLFHRTSVEYLTMPSCEAPHAEDLPAVEFEAVKSVMYLYRLHSQISSSFSQALLEFSW